MLPLKKAFNLVRLFSLRMNFCIVEFSSCPLKASKILVAHQLWRSPNDILLYMFFPNLSVFCSILFFYYRKLVRIVYTTRRSCNINLMTLSKESSVDVFCSSFACNLLTICFGYTKEFMYQRRQISNCWSWRQLKQQDTKTFLVSEFQRLITFFSLELLNPAPRC